MKTTILQCLQQFSSKNSKNLYYHLYAAYMRWISGGFFVKKHLTQGTLSC